MQLDDRKSAVPSVSPPVAVKKLVLCIDRKVGILSQQLLKISWVYGLSHHNKHKFWTKNFKLAKRNKSPMLESTIQWTQKKKVSKVDMLNELPSCTILDPMNTCTFIHKIDGIITTRQTNWVGHKSSVHTLSWGGGTNWIKTSTIFRQLMKCVCHNNHAGVCQQVCFQTDRWYTGKLKKLQKSVVLSGTQVIFLR